MKDLKMHEKAILEIIKAIETIPQSIRHIFIGLAWFLVGWQYDYIAACCLCSIMALVAEFRDEIEHITKSSCHPRGFEFDDLLFRILPVIVYGLLWMIMEMVF